MLHAPNFLPERAADVGHALDPVAALRVDPAVSEHLHHNRILLAVFLEDQLALRCFVLVLSAFAVLASLSFVLRHVGWSAVVLELVASFGGEYSEGKRGDFTLKKIARNKVKSVVDRIQKADG